MYLSYLKPLHKEAFLDLSLIVSNADHKLNIPEKNLIGQLCEEMGIEPKASCERSLDAVLADIQATATRKEKKIILLELLGIVMVDKDIQVEELDIVNILINELELNKSDLEEAIALVKQIFGVYSDCAEFING